MNDFSLFRHETFKYFYQCNKWICDVFPLAIKNAMMTTINDAAAVVAVGY